MTTRMTRTIAVLLGLVLVGDAAALGASSEFRREVRMSVSRQGGGFSELAFVDPVGLPASVHEGGRATMRFSITNRTGSDATYDLVASVVGEGSRVTLLQQRVRLDDGASLTRSLTFVPRRAGRFMVDVQAAPYRIHHAVLVT